MFSFAAWNTPNSSLDISTHTDHPTSNQISSNNSWTSSIWKDNSQESIVSLKNSNMLTIHRNTNLWKWVSTKRSMRYQKDLHLQNFFNHGRLIKIPASFLFHIPPFSKRSCITSIRQSSNLFSPQCLKGSSSFMHGTSVVRHLSQSLVPIVVLCSFVCISGAAFIIVSIFFNHLPPLCKRQVRPRTLLSKFKP